MSVYTLVGRDELAAWLRSCGAGELIDFSGISAGVQNSNYFVTTSTGRWVLTLFEGLPAKELDFYLRLMAHLGRRGFPCPQPWPDQAGNYQRALAGKPAALVSRLEGACIEAPDGAHCRAIGMALAELHRLTADFPAPLPHPRGQAWCRAMAAKLLPLLAPAERDLLADELAFQAAQDFSRLPQAVIHADLFRDNVLWQPDHRLSGILDFYFAGQDCQLFDLAVAANDWCADAAGLAALVDGYQQIRPLSPAEQAAWPAQRRAAALRFWLSRLDDAHHPRPGEMVTVKDPAHFGTMLEALRLAPGGSAG